MARGGRWLGDGRRGHHRAVGLGLGRGWSTTVASGSSHPREAGHRPGRRSWRRARRRRGGRAPTPRRRRRRRAPAPRRPPAAASGSAWPDRLGRPVGGPDTSSGWRPRLGPHRRLGVAGRLDLGVGGDVRPGGRRRDGRLGRLGGVADQRAGVELGGLALLRRQVDVGRDGAARCRLGRERHGELAGRRPARGRGGDAGASGSPGSDDTAWVGASTSPENEGTACVGASTSEVGPAGATALGRRGCSRARRATARAPPGSRRSRGGQPGGGAVGGAGRAPGAPGAPAAGRRGRRALAAGRRVALGGGPGVGGGRVAAPGPGPRAAHPRRRPSRSARERRRALAHGPPHGGAAPTPAGTPAPG